MTEKGRPAPTELICISDDDDDEIPIKYTPPRNSTFPTTSSNTPRSTLPTTSSATPAQNQLTCQESAVNTRYIYSLRVCCVPIFISWRRGEGSKKRVYDDYDENDVDDADDIHEEYEGEQDEEDLAFLESILNITNLMYV
jgi:hypothetical protein